MKKTIVLLLCIATLTGLLCGCDAPDHVYIPTGDALDSTDVVPGGTRPEPVQQLRMAYFSTRSMNPFTATDVTNRAILPLLYQGLFSTDRNYNTVPILCAGYVRSRDMMTHTFTLAEATFSDGSLLSAEDVVASLQAARDGGYYAGRFTHITSVTAEQGKVVITTDIAMADLALLLDIPIVKAGQTLQDHPIGTGPYVLDYTMSGLQLRRRSDWWCNAVTAVTASFIPLEPVSTVKEVRDEFEIGDVGLVCTDPGVDGYVDYRCDYEIWDCESGYFLYLGINRNSKVLSDEKIRTALTHAIDRDKLVETYYRDFGRSALLPASPLSPVYDHSLAADYGYNLEKAMQALSGLEPEKATITLLVSSGQKLRLQVGNAIADMLRQCGFTVTVTSVTAENFQTALKQGKYDLYLAETKLSPNMDLSAFFAPKGSLGYGGLENAPTYALCREALANAGNFYNLHKQVMDNGWLCPILVRTYGIYATRSLITDLTPTRDNLFFYTLGKTLDDVLTKGA